MLGNFNSAAVSASEAERALKDWGIWYDKRMDGTLFIPGNLDISDKGLARLPDLSSVDVVCSFLCDRNRLTSLEGAPHSIGLDFSCAGNRLISLKGAPPFTRRSFYCDRNQLTSLEYAPQIIGRNFSCSNNQLTSLEHAPPKFEILKSDFGEFSLWHPIPDELRVSPATRARLERERQAQVETAVHDATILQSAMRVRGPLNLKRKAFRA